MAEDREEALQADVADALGSVRARRVSLDAISPQDRETLAAWIESRYESYAAAAVKGENLLRQGVAVAGLENQVQYWRVATAVSRQLAYFLRRYRVRRSKGEKE